MSTTPVIPLANHKETHRFTQQVLLWYDDHRRDLPWRNISDPYRIWVSEIILQQTRVAQGYAYYQRLVEAFPTVEALAEAPEDKVLLMWQGLGYYSRARRLHEAARQIVQQGGFPTTYEGILALPGVGAYTAAAIASFAYHLPHAVLDGNVYRVLSRYFGVPTPIDTGTGKKAFTQLAQMLLPEKRSADYNQGVMDFGALQCVPQSPDCASCPLADACAAYGSDAVGYFPVKSRATKVTERHFVYLYLPTPAGIWLQRRGAGDIWQGLYEMPLLEFDHVPSKKEVQAHPFMRQFGKNVSITRVVKRKKHVLTHRRLWADCYVVQSEHYPEPPEPYFCVPHSLLADYAMPRLVQLLLDKVLQNESQRFQDDSSYLQSELP